MLVIKCNEKTLKLYDCNNVLCFYFLEDKKQLSVRTRNEYDKIFDWWSQPTYRKSHLIRRFELLQDENKMLDYIEKNIDIIYQAIGNKIQEEKLKEQKETLDNIYTLEKSNELIPMNKIVKITIEFCE